MTNNYYERCCYQRLQDLLYWVAKARPGQTITEDYVFRNATLANISKGSASTQRIIDWCKEEISRRRSEMSPETKNNC